VKSFVVADFRAAFWGALVISLVSMVLNLITGDSRVEIRRSKSRSGDRDGDGPVIDV